MRGTRRFGWLATAAAIAGLTFGTGPAGAATPYIATEGALQDLQPATVNATDGAYAEVWILQTATRSTYWFLVSDLTAPAGTKYGAHVHVGPCVAGNGAAAGPHYNTGGTASPETEVWLDFTVLGGGYGYASTTVPFVIEPGKAQAIIIHAEPTQPGPPTPGAAGGRQACLPVNF